MGGGGGKHGRTSSSNLHTFRFWDVFFCDFFAFFTCQSCQGNWVCPQFDTMKSLNYARVLIEFN